MEMRLFPAFEETCIIETEQLYTVCGRPKPLLYDVAELIKSSLSFITKTSKTCPGQYENKFSQFLNKKKLK